MDIQLKQRFDNFNNEIDVENLEKIWEAQSKKFRDFWTDKIMNEDYPQLTDSEIDEIVLILDKNAKGSSKNTISVAKVMIPQGVWRRLFKEIQDNKKLKTLLYSVFTETDKNKQIRLIDELYIVNQGRKNSLTGQSGNALNTMLFAFNPHKYSDVVSLNDRKLIIEHFNLDCTVNFEKDSQGKKIIESNDSILNGFKKYDVDAPPFIVSTFLYRRMKPEWKPSTDSDTSEVIDESSTETKEEEYLESKSTFYMEKELENFLIKNWDKTELGQKYELIEEDGEIVSQQYKTDIGKIDILVKDKQTGQYVVIELKKDQTSDDTVGQLARYMGWIEEHKNNNGKSTKGIIIASTFDSKLYYALKKLKDAEVYTYEINFKIKEFNKK